MTDEYVVSAVTAVKESDIVIACLGESVQSSGEGVTKAKISLPQDQINLLKAIKKCGKKIVTILFNGRPIVLDEVLEISDAVLEAWYPGTMGGKAIALLLSGKETPSGKLTQTFPRHSGQIPIAYNERRTFSVIEPSDLSKGPQFPFGYGLSYTQFEYSDLTVSSDTLHAGEYLEVSVRIKNIGKRKGREIVQLYIRDEVASVVPRERMLRDFTSITLMPGEQRTIRFNLSPESFKIYDNHMNYVIESGKFVIQVGPDSQQLYSKTIQIL